MSKTHVISVVIPLYIKAPTSDGRRTRSSQGGVSLVPRDTTTGRQIGALAHESYGLTEEEIRIGERERRL